MLPRRQARLRGDERARPELADAVADILTDRKVALATARDAADDDAAARRADAKHDLLGRIRSFFALR